MSTIRLTLQTVHRPGVRAAWLAVLAIGFGPALAGAGARDVGEPGSPKEMPPSDATEDAAGRGQLFESIHVPGLTDFIEGTNGAAFADLNHDGWLDIVTVTTEPFVLGQTGDDVRDLLRFLINRGGFVFEPQEITLTGSATTPEDFGQGWRGSQIPSLADFDGDGYLDLFVSRQCPCRGGELRDGFTAVGNSLFISDGSFHTLVDRSEELEVTNRMAYNRQPSFGDVNRDGFLDIAVGADNTTNAFEGRPHSVLLVFEPFEGGFEGGRFVDIGGTDQIPDFGGFYRDSAKDKGGPNVALRDIDNDGDIDLLQSTHVLMDDRYNPRVLPLSPVLYRQGVFTWRNLLEETGEFRFEKSIDNGLAGEARLTYDEVEQIYVPAGPERAPGLAYLLVADVTNDGLDDVITVDASDPTFTPKTEDVGGRFWYNDGGFTFSAATEAAGLGTLNDTYEGWYEFFDNEIPWLLRVPVPVASPAQPGLDPIRPIDLRPYHADAIFADFDNDTWVDLVLLDRRESNNIETRGVLYLNQGDGVFEPVTTEISGIDSTGIGGEAVDLNNDGRVDLFVSGDPDNSEPDGSQADRYEDKVYLNTGAVGRDNHWLRLRFSGVSDAELIGARVEIFAVDNGARLGSRGVYSNHAYKTGSPLEAHFGLGPHEQVDLRVTLISGDVVDLDGVAGDRFIDLDLSTGTTTVVYLGEVTGLEVADREDGGLDLAFDVLAGAESYAVYFGRLATLHGSGTYDHGTDPPSGPLCEVTTEPAGPGRLRTTVAAEDVPGTDAYILVTGHIDGVESPTGFASNSLERDVAESTCP